MIDFQIPLMSVDAAAFLVGADYAAVTLAEIEVARHRLWISMFIMGVAVRLDPRVQVRELADAITRAARRGVDTRVLLDPFQEEGDESPGNLVAAHYLTGRGVPARLYKSADRPTDHAKTIIVDDDTLVIASGNWTPGGLDANVETGVLVRSSGMCEQLANRFRREWEAGMTPDALP